jgi:hypothetical protein
VAAELTNTGETEGGGSGEERDTEERVDSGEDGGEAVSCAASSASALSAPTFPAYSRGAGERGTADSAGGEVAACSRKMADIYAVCITCIVCLRILWSSAVAQHSPFSPGSHPGRS